jgi:hypothetical protein
LPIRAPTRLATDGSHRALFGDVVIDELRWGVQAMGFPGREVELPVIARGETVGRFVLIPTPGEPVSFDRRVVAVALADQVGAALASSSGAHC